MRFGRRESREENNILLQSSILVDFDDNISTIATGLGQPVSETVVVFVQQYIRKYGADEKQIANLHTRPPLLSNKKERGVPTAVNTKLLRDQ